MTVFFVIVRMGETRSELVAAPQGSLLLLFVLFAVRFADAVIGGETPVHLRLGGTLREFDPLAFALVGPSLLPLAVWSSDADERVPCSPPEESHGGLECVEEGRERLRYSRGHGGDHADCCLEGGDGRVVSFRVFCSYTRCAMA